jgi:hypothetical protein
MTSIDFLIANALVPADFVPDLLRQLALPALDILAAQGSAFELKASHGELMPAWLAWPFRKQATVNPAVGWSRAFDVELTRGRSRIVLQPIHLAIGQHGLSLSDPDLLALSQQEHGLLLESLEPLLSSEGIDLVGGDGAHWLADLPADMVLRGALPDMALHEEVLPWLPQGDAARQWRRISTEIQMVLHQHVVNQGRESDGRLSVSSLWLSGGGPTDALAALPYASVKGMPRWVSSWPLVSTSSAHLDAAPQLTGFYFEEDWSSFRIALQAIDQRLMSHLNALRAGEIGQLNVILSGAQWLREVTVKRSDLYKFWRRGKAAELLDLPE